MGDDAAIQKARGWGVAVAAIIGDRGAADMHETLGGRGVEDAIEGSP